MSHAESGPWLGFVAEREFRCVGLCSQLVQEKKTGQQQFRSLMIIESREIPAETVAVVGVGTNGIVYHCFRNTTLTAREAENLSALVAPWLEKIPFSCILGDREGNLFLEYCTPVRPVRSVDYILLSLEDERALATRQAPAEKLSPPRLMGPEDTDLLMPLQEGYEKEEVMGPGEVFIRTRSRANLLKNLDTQLVWALFDGDRPVAKAGTNARGFLWDQIGGVYTEPRWRGQGCAQTLLAHICRDLQANARKIVLFVKEHNTAAMTVYLKTGFTKKGHFRITYF